MPHDDQKYIDALATRDEAIVNEIHKRFAPECMRYILKNGGTDDNAREIFQKALIKISLNHQSNPIELQVPFGEYLYPFYRDLWRKKMKPHDDQKYIDALVNRNEPLVEEIYQKYAPQCKRNRRSNRNLSISHK